MKTISKVLSVILVISMMLGTVAYAAKFTDVSTDKSYYEPVYVLSSLGIINGYEDGTFGPEKDVTRAEFATMLMRAMASAGFGSSDPEGTPFTDLNDASWAISDVRTCYDLGIINGMTETTFEPNSNVTYEQALKMIVCALNYGPSAQEIQNKAEKQEWYYGYMQVAYNLKLTDRISVVYGSPAKRWEIAQMIYNSFDIKMLEKLELSGGGAMYQESNLTLLGDKLNVKRGKGELIADGTSTLDASGKVAREGYVLIKDSTTNEVLNIAKKDISVSNLLGKNVEYYYKEDSSSDKYLVCILNKTSESSSIKINENNIDSISGTYSSGYTITYYASDDATKTSKATVDANPVISVNGEVKTGLSASELIPETGTIELIASNGGNYNKINISSYDTYVVKSVNTTDKYVVDMYRSASSTKPSTLSLDDSTGEYTISLSTTSNSVISVGGIAQYNVISVKDTKGNGNRVTRNAIVSTKNVTGTINEIDLEEDKIKIADSTYKVSRYLNNMAKENTNASTSLSTLSVGDNCKAYLDKDDRICYITKTATGGAIYGYLVEAGKEGNDLKFAILSSKSSKVGSPYFKAANKVRIDGVSYSSKDSILEALLEGGKVYNHSSKSKYAQLIKFKLNSSSEITDIETAYTNPDTEDENDETLFKYYSVAKKTGDVMKYVSSSMDFVGATNSDKFRINSSTKVFLVPKDVTDYSLYGMKAYSYFNNGSTYRVEAYNVTGTLNVAGAVVVYQTEETEASVNYSYPMFLITAMSQTTNSDGVPCDKVVGYNISTSGAVSTKTVYSASAGDISDNYEIGDVIVYAVTNSGEINTKTIRKLFSPKDYVAQRTRLDNTKYDGINYYSEQFSGMLLGSDLDDTNQMFDIALVQEVSECESAESVSFNANGNTKYFTYNTKATSNESKVTQQEGTLDLSSFPSYIETQEKGEPNATKLFVYKYGENVRMVYVIK